MTAEEFQDEAKRIRPKLISTAIRYLRDADEAEDMVQDAMLKLWVLCGQLNKPMDNLALVLVRNIAVDHIRRHRTFEEISENDAETDEGDAEEHKKIERMMSIVDALPDALQIIIRLRHVEGMDYKDIARLTDSSETAVRKSMSRARMAIKNKYLERFENEK